jgi:methylmalonyl-CoA/ethylmalonyl-CoA epimerase
MTNAGAIDHVAVAVRSLEAAWRLFGETLGGAFIAGGDDDRLKIRTIQLMLPPGVKIELMQPIDESSYLHAFIEKHGEGFHHVTTFFEDLRALITDLDAAGFTTVDSDFSDPGWYETFVRPSVGFGALFQNVQTDQDWTARHEHITLEDVLAGNVVWDGAKTWLRSDDG